MSLKVKGNWVEWKNVTVNEIRAQLATGVLDNAKVKKLLEAHVLSDEVTGWAFKFLYKKKDISGWPHYNKFIFDE